MSKLILKTPPRQPRKLKTGTDNILVWDNFVPGRSLHLNTNPWLHFAHLLHPASGIRFAIPSLMGIYFCDYLSGKENQESAMRAYRKATQCLSHLRSNRELEEESTDEIISLLIVLSLRAVSLSLPISS